MSTNQNILETLSGRLVAGLVAVGDLDALQGIYVSNSVADKAPRFQRVMLAMIQTERARRDQGEAAGPKGVEVPEFSDWQTSDLFMAGMAVVTGAETAALTGDPPLINFAFRLLQMWFAGEGRRYTETPTHAA